jgi:steroid delta-isomerase-like uncharacterized protein
MKKYFSVIPLVLLLCFVVGCQDKTSMAELEEFRAQAAVEEQNKDVVKRYWEGKWNDRRPQILDELQTPDVKYHGTSMQMNNLEEYKQVYNMYLSAFQDTHVTIEELIAEGDKVMSRVSWTATHTGDLGELPATGKTGTVTVLTVFRLVNGKIAEEWEVMDELGLMTQLGLELKPKEAGIK